MIKLERVQLISRGMTELLKSEEMASCVKGIADERASSLGSGYSTDSYNASTRQIASIFTSTMEAAKDNNRNNTLLKAVGR